MKIIFKIALFFIIFINNSVAGDIESKNLYLSYNSYPKRVFTNQRFIIDLKAIILNPKDTYNKIITTFAGAKNLQIITQDPIWIQQKNNQYSTKLQFKAEDKKFILPTITLALFYDDEIVDYISLDPLDISFEQIAIDQNLFSNIIASNIDILQVNTKQYDNNNILATIVLEAQKSNLEDIYLKGYKEQGIESYSDKENIQRLYYYVVIPIHKKVLKFTYYNTRKKDFILLNINVTLKEELVSTQTNLNPYNSNLLFYKQIIAIILFLIFACLLYLRKNLFYFITTTILLLIVTYLFIPNKKIVLEKNKKIYILPTKNSTIFKITTKKELVEVINTKNNFKKIILKNKNIGWIKDDR